MQIFQAIQESAGDRLTICESCEHYNANFKRCAKCGCFMPAKVALPMASCPIGKWGKVVLSEIQAEILRRKRDDRLKKIQDQKE